MKSRLIILIALVLVLSLVLAGCEKSGQEVVEPSQPEESGKTVDPNAGKVDGKTPPEPTNTPKAKGFEGPYETKVLSWMPSYQRNACVIDGYMYFNSYTTTPPLSKYKIGDDKSKSVGPTDQSLYCLTPTDNAIYAISYPIYTDENMVENELVETTLSKFEDDKIEEIFSNKDSFNIDFVVNNYIFYSDFEGIKSYNLDTGEHEIYVEAEYPYVLPYDDGYVYFQKNGIYSLYRFSLSAPDNVEEMNIGETYMPRYVYKGEIYYDHVIDSENYKFQIEKGKWEEDPVQILGELDNVSDYVPYKDGFLIMQWSENGTASSLNSCDINGKEIGKIGENVFEFASFGDVAYYTTSNMYSIDLPQDSTFEDIEYQYFFIDKDGKQIEFKPE